MDSQQQGPYQYYQPPPPRRSGETRRSFSDHQRSTIPTANGVNRVGETRGDLGITTGPLRVDPNAVPLNIRTTAWSPDMTSPRSQAPPRQQQTAMPSQQSPATEGGFPGTRVNATETLRRGSVPDKSPLQRLERELSNKGEKRARVEQAEHRARQKSLGGGASRVVSDGSRRPSESTRKERPRQVSAEVPPNSGVSNLRSAGEASRSNLPYREVGNKVDDDDDDNGGYFVHRHNQRPSASEPKPAPLAPSGPRDQPPPRQQQTANSSRSTSGSTSNDMNRTASGKYKHRARDAGFAGASAIMASAEIIPKEDAAERGKAAHERRRSYIQADLPQSSPVAATAPTRSESKKIREQSDPRREADSSGGPISREKVATVKNDPVNYKIPPQTAAAQSAREQVGFSSDTPQDKSHHRLGGLFHRSEHRSYEPSTKPLDEWRNGGIARLTAEDLELEQVPPAAVAGAVDDGSAAWWEKKNQRTSSSGSRPSATAQLDGPYEEEAKHFRPPLHLKCGPLLRYTGIRMEVRGPRASVSAEREIWRGSVMIVTHDDLSDYSAVPSLRLFAQPMDLHTPPPQHLLDAGHELPPEYEDPVAGQVKLSRTGRPIFVRPVHDIDGEVDLSRVENPQGLYAATRTSVLGPQTVGGPDGRLSRHITFQDKSRVKRRDGEKLKRYRDVRAVRLHTERGCTFWRFNLEIELSSKQHRVAYRINKGPAIGFWVPPSGETMNIMFHSCNGFSMSVDSNLFSGPDPLWRDVLNRHQSRPFHVMIGGGDQLYNDCATRDAKLFKAWLETKNPEHKHSADFTPEMQVELEEFYLERYAMWFSQGLFAMANSQIPMINIWDDHDIMDGFGSYPHHFMNSRVFTGLGTIAFKYYMLFQHQSLVAETEKEEPSWLLGAGKGPYINERSRSLFMHLGRKVAFLGLDCRTERMRDEILCQDSYDIVFDRCRDEIVSNTTRHLIVLLGVPIAYPRLNFLENILTSKVMDPIKALGRTGALGGFVNKFDGGVEILDDLDDHCTAKHHKAERNWFVQELRGLRGEKGVRITILGGDVHLGAVGQFYSEKRMGLSKDKDHRYMPNVISSAIVNTPPPTMMADVLNRRNKVHHLDDQTDEDLIPMFDTDVDGSVRNNKHLLPRRNYCTIREYVPGSTPRPSPKLEPRNPDTSPIDDRKYPPGSMNRTMSLTRGPMNLVRRLSGSGRAKNPPVSTAPEHARSNSAQSQIGPGGQRSNSMGSRSIAPSEYGSQRPTNQFLRRPTTLSVKEARKAAAKGGADGNLDGREHGQINLEGGLDISLNMEISQKDPSGATVPYRLLVPALWYEGEPDENTARFKGRRVSLMNRIKGRLNPGQQGQQYHQEKVNEEEEDEGEGEGEYDDDDYSRTPSPSPPPAGRRRQQEAHASAPNFSPASNVAPSRAAYIPAPGTAYDGADGYDNPNNITPAKPTPRFYAAGGSSYQKGYDLSGPPIGGGSYPPQEDRQQRRASVNNNPYPQSGYRRASAPGMGTAPRQQPLANEPWRDRHEYGDEEGSMTGSEEGWFEDEAGKASIQQPRRGSKAERFLGLADEGQSGDGGDGVGDGATKRKGWKIWK